MITFVIFIFQSDHYKQKASNKKIFNKLQQIRFLMFFFQTSSAMCMYNTVLYSITI